MLEFINQNAGVITLFFTAVVAIATVFYVRLTRKLVNETMELRKAQIQPQLFISILPRDPEVWIVDMIIENVGNGAAYNVKMNPSKNFEMRSEREFNNIGFIKNGYNYFAPHQRLKFFFTNLVDNKKQKEDVKFTIDLSYQDQYGKTYSSEHRVDLSEFYGLPRYDNPPIYDLANSLMKIEKSINLIIEKKLDVNIYTEEDRIKLEKEQKEKLEREHKELKGRGLLWGRDITTTPLYYPNFK